MILCGIGEFRKQAEQAKAYFSERTQVIRSIKHEDGKPEIQIEYSATLGVDFPNGMKKGQQLILTDKSVVEFEKGRIIRLTDIS